MGVSLPPAVDPPAHLSELAFLAAAFFCPGRRCHALREVWRLLERRLYPPEHATRQPLPSRGPMPHDRSWVTSAPTYQGSDQHEAHGAHTVTPGPRVSAQLGVGAQLLAAPVPSLFCMTLVRFRVIQFSPAP